ncbi:MAG: class I SAM-dependent methyltransferase, partial [Nostocaceae cyanobacterium]|nr:class I SAM-dependent methyltransferase [Nostocaceae cyanobacterium]
MQQLVTMKNYHLISWLEQDKVNQTSFFKRLVYFLGRPLLSAYNCRYLSRNTLTTFKPSFVLLGRGMPFETRRLWGAALCNIKESTILVQGTGTGWDVLSWARLKPKKIIATDLFEFKESWEQIAAYCQDLFGVDVEFHQSPLENNSFLSDASIDLCASDTVFEHCLDLKSVLKESLRVLKPGGTLYASYGPLWFCAGGDHFSGRGGLKNAFNHLLLEPEEYMKYFKEFLKEDEDFQSGGRYVEIDLFSRLNTQQYYNLFQESGFKTNSFILQISPTSLAFNQEFPSLFLQLQEKYSHKCEIDDFLIHTHLV